MDNLVVIERYLRDCFGEQLSMSHPTRRSFALDALTQELGPAGAPSEGRHRP
jgi:hypothetical protein